MGKSVEQGGCHLCIAEYRRPLAEAEVCRDHDTCSFIELAQQMEEESAARGAEGQVAQLIEDHHVGAPQCLGDLAGLASGLFLFESIDEFDGGEEAGLLAMMLNGLDTERRGERRNVMATVRMLVSPASRVSCQRPEVCLMPTVT